MKNARALILLTLLMFNTPAAWGQGATTKVRGAASLPSTCSPSGANTAADTIIVNGVYYICTATNMWTSVRGLETANTWMASQAFKGPIPWADVTAFGAIPTSYAGVSTTATISAGSLSTATVAAHGYVFGEGLTIYGAGATNTMSTPSAPVTEGPVLAQTGTLPTGPRFNWILGPTGSSTYNYRVVARDLHGGLTAASRVLMIKNGLATLGLNTLPVTRMSRSNNTVTVNTSGTQNLAVGALVHLSGSSDATFSGWFNVTMVNNAGNSFTIANTGFDTRLGDASSATGGVVRYYNGIRLDIVQVAGAWEYYICAQRPGDSSYKLIGSTDPTGQSSGDFPGNVFYDWGDTLLGNQTYPAYVTNAVCTSSKATNDPLTTTVTAVDSSGYVLTLANAATHAVTGATTLLDDAPAILAAANSVSWNSPGYSGGTVYLPPVPSSGGRLGYIVNSYLKLPPNTTLRQAGSLWVNETIEVSSNSNWDGSWSAPASGHFGFSGRANINCLKANPCIYSNVANNSTYQDLSVLRPYGTNGGILWFSDDGYQLTWKDMSFDTNGNGSGDYVGTGMVMRSTTTGGNPYHFDHVSFSGGPNQVTDASWAPLLYFPQSSNSGGAAVASSPFIDMKSMFFNLRGIQLDADGGTLGLWDIDWLYRQGGITPLLTLFNGNGKIFGLVNMTSTMQDTETSSTVALLNAPSQSNQVSIHFNQVMNASAETGGIPPSATGQLPYNIVYDEAGVTMTHGPGSIVIGAGGIAAPMFQGAAIQATGAAAGLSGTGACTMINMERGGAWGGSFKCAGPTGASTVVITPGFTAPNGWSCSASDITTANTLRQSAFAAKNCTISGMIKSNDVITFTAVAF
jgi:hypothetical protein